MAQAVDSIMFQLIAEVNKNPEWRVIYDALMAIARPADQTRTRTGGDVDQIANQQIRELLPWFSVANESEINRQYDFPQAHDLPLFVSTASSHTTAGDEIVEATGAITVTLNATPANEERVTVKRNATAGDVTIDGNGHNIDGDSTYTMLINYEGIDLIYSIESGVWLIV